MIKPGKLMVCFCAILLITSMACEVSISLNPSPTIPANTNVLPNNLVPNPADNPVQNGENPPAEFKLTGIWESQTDTGFGTTMYTELIINPNKTFSQQVTVADLMAYDTGIYEVGEGFIHFVVQDHEPKVYKGKQMSWITSFTYFYTPVDANTVAFEDRVAGSQWTAYRK